MKIGKIRIVLLALALLPLLSSCKLDEPESPIQELQSYECRFSIVEETKALLNDNGVFWVDGDQVGLFAGSGASVVADVDVTTTPKRIVYSSGSPLSAGTIIFSYYPFQAGNTSASAAKITIPANQQGGTQSAMPMAGIPFAVTEGQGTQGSVYFLNLGSVIDFRVYSDKYAGEQIESITLAVTSGSHAVSGDATINLTSVASGNESSLSLTWPEGVASSVTLSQAGTVATSKEKAVEAGSMLMVVAPGTYSGTITIVTDVANYTFSFTDKEFTRNSIKGFNMNLNNAVRNKLSFRLENDKMAAYLDYMDAHPYDTANYSYSYVYEYSKDKSSSNRLDLPLPVTLSWISTQTGTMSADVYYDSAHTQPEPMAYVKFSSDAHSVDIYNLIPNRHYYYVIKAGNETVASGEFNTTGHRRILYVADPPCGKPYANNCRDIGGLKTIDGRTVKYGKIFRGSNMDSTTTVQQNYIKNVMRVGLDVDLRKDKDSTSASSDGKAMFNALNLFQIPKSTNASNTSDTYEGHTRESYDSWTNLTTAYIMGPTLTRIINAAVNGKGVYIHCTVGADRTGFVCLMLEAILGVKQGLCDVDYELTSFSPDVGSNPYRRRTDQPTSWYYYPMGINAINNQPGATFQQKAIDYAVNVLRVPAEKITAFQNCMLE